MHIALETYFAYASQRAIAPGHLEKSTDRSLGVSPRATKFTEDIETMTARGLTPGQSNLEHRSPTGVILGLGPRTHGSASSYDDSKEALKRHTPSLTTPPSVGMDPWAKPTAVRFNFSCDIERPMLAGTIDRSDDAGHEKCKTISAPPLDGEGLGVGRGKETGSSP